MPYYKPLELLDENERIWIVENLQNLRKQLKKDVPPRTNRSTLLLSTWNLREFSNSKNRLEESFWYIAEIISFFDLVAVQEIGNNMTALQKLMGILGYKYDYIVTDTPDSQGGSERIAFIYNTGKVKFKNIAGEVSLTKKDKIKYKLPDGFARPPFSVAFQASWFKFNLCSVHIYYGTKNDTERRENEIKAITAKINKRVKDEDATYILLGDFNIENVNDKFHEALVGTKKKPTGFYVPKGEKGKVYFTNSKNDKTFDQIAINFRNLILKDLKISDLNKELGKGVVDYYESIFNDENHYKKVATKMYKEKDYIMPENWQIENWRTFQMSDHLPLWVELKIDFTDEYLETLINTKVQKPDVETEIPKNI